MNDHIADVITASGEVFPPERFVSGESPLCRSRRPNPQSIPESWALVPTEEELIAAERARNAFKADQRIFALSDHYALEQQQRRGGGL
jgi:hypothetical protein